MTVFYLSFRLSSDKTMVGTYDQRYDALLQSLKKISDGYWLKPTSFWIFNSEKSRAQVAATVKAAIDPKKDMAVIGMVEKLGVTVVGDYKDDIAVLRSMIPDIDEY